MPFSGKDNFKPTDPRMVSLSVYNVGYERCHPGYQWGPGVRNHFLIHHVIEGKGYYRIGETTYALKSGDSFLVYPYTEISYHADPEDPWTYCWVGFAGTDAPLIIQSTDFTKENPVFPAPSREADSRIRSLMLSIYDARGNDIQSSVAMTGALYTALAYFVGLSHHSDHPAKLSEISLKRATDFIASNYFHPISVEEIAEYVGISRSHLFRLFSSHLGCSPKEYLTDFRIRQACSLLKNTDLSIIAISRSVGFEDNLYFSKAFRKARGISPSEYRRG